MYINLLHLLLFNFACLFCLFFLSFLSSQHICQFCFHCFIPQWASCFSFVFQFMLQLILFLTGRYNCWFPLFARLIYCTLVLLDCFDYDCGCICICVYSVTFFIVVINLCHCVGLLQFYGIFHFLKNLSYSFSIFSIIFLKFLIYIFLNPLCCSIFITFLAFSTVLFPLQLILMNINILHLLLFNFEHN